MEVKIGVQNAARELSVDTEENSESVLAKLNSALQEGALFTLADAKGNTVAVPADKVAYLNFTADTGRKVGFGLGSS